MGKLKKIILCVGGACMLTVALIVGNYAYKTYQADKSAKEAAAELKRKQDIVNSYSEISYNNKYFGEISLSGMTVEEIVSELKKESGVYSSRKVRFSVDGDEYTYSMKKLKENIYYKTSDGKKYKLGQEDEIAERVVAMDKDKDKTVIRMLQENSKAYNMFPVLVLVDGIAFYDHSEVLAYNAHNIHYIHQYRGNYALGEMVYGGILSLVTHRGTLPDMRIKDEMQMVSYEFPQDRPMFEMPNYEDAEIKESRRPDFRHTMYWNPSVEGKEGVEFYTSDLEGTYIATLQGVTADGQKIEEKWEFEVK